MTYQLTSSFPYLLNRVGVSMGDLFLERIAQYELNLPMYRALAVLRQEGPQNLGALSEMISTEISTVSRLISTLKRRGLVSRIRPDDNARIVQIDLTPTGIEMIETLMPIAAQFEAIGTTDFSPDEIQWLKDALIKIHQNFQNYRESSQD